MMFVLHEICKFFSHSRQEREIQPQEMKKILGMCIRLANHDVIKRSDPCGELETNPEGNIFLAFEPDEAKTETGSSRTAQDTVKTTQAQRASSSVTSRLDTLPVGDAESMLSKMDTAAGEADQAVDDERNAGPGDDPRVVGAAGSAPVVPPSVAESDATANATSGDAILHRNSNSVTAVGRAVVSNTSSGDGSNNNNNVSETIGDRNSPHSEDESGLGDDGGKPGNDICPKVEYTREAGSDASNTSSKTGNGDRNLSTSSGSDTSSTDRMQLSKNCRSDNRQVDLTNLAVNRNVNENKTEGNPAGRPVNVSQNMMDEDQGQEDEPKQEDREEGMERKEEAEEEEEEEEEEAVAEGESPQVDREPELQDQVSQLGPDLEQSVLKPQSSGPTGGGQSNFEILLKHFSLPLRVSVPLPLPL